MNNKAITVEYILNEVIQPCSWGFITSERPQLKVANAFLCAKEIFNMLENKNIFLNIEKRDFFKNHNQGKKIISDWAISKNLEFSHEIDVSVGVADVVIYASDLGIFEIGTTKPIKMLLLLKYIFREKRSITVHFWPYESDKAFIFRNWK